MQKLDIAFSVQECEVTNEIGPLFYSEPLLLRAGRRHPACCLVLTFIGLFSRVKMLVP